MGIYVELHSTSGKTIDPQELKKRLIEAGAKPFPKDPAYDTSGKYNVPGLKGFLRLEREKNIKSGIWASVRLSWASDRKTWKSLLDIAERIKGRMYDSTLDQYITYEMIDDVVEHYSSGVNMLGKAGKKEETTKNSDDKESSRKNRRRKRKRTDMSDDGLFNVLKRIVDSEAKAGEDLLFENQFSKKDIIKAEDVVDPDKNRWDMSLIKPLLHLKKLLGSEKNPGKMCNEIERKTTEWLETNPDSRLPSYVSGKAYILDKYLRELLSEKKSEEIAESINMELWRGIEKVKFLTIFNPIWEEGVANAVKDYFEKTPKERRVSIAKEINETIDKFVQELKQQNSK